MRRAGLSPVPLPPGRKPAISGIAAARTGHRRRDAPADPAFVGVLQLAHVDAGRHRRLHVRCRHRLRRSGGPPPAQDRRATAPLAARRVARHSTETEPGDAGRSVDAPGSVPWMRRRRGHRDPIPRHVARVRRRRGPERGVRALRRALRAPSRAGGRARDRGRRRAGHADAPGVGAHRPRSRRLRRQARPPQSPALHPGRSGGLRARPRDAGRRTRRLRQRPPFGGRSDPLSDRGSSLLRLQNFRWLGASVLLNSVGMMAEVVALGWLALELTSSPLLVGVAMGMRALPLFFVGVPAGALADRVPRHRLLMATGAGQALTSATLGTLTLLGTVRLPHLLVLTLAAGVLRGVEHAARQSYTHDVVGAAGLVKGFAVLGVAMRAGWLLGSLSVGAIIARFHTGGGYLFVAGGYLAGAIVLLLVSPPAPTSPPSETGSLWSSVTEFLTAVRTDQALLVLLALTAGAELLGFAHQVVLPSLARDVLHAGPEGLGVLNGARAVGGILGLAAAALTRGAARGAF